MNLLDTGREEFMVEHLYDTIGVFGDDEFERVLPWQPREEGRRSMEDDKSIRDRMKDEIKSAGL